MIAPTQSVATTTASTRHRAIVRAPTTAPTDVPASVINGSVGATMGLVGGIVVAMFIEQMYKALGGQDGLITSSRQILARVVQWAVVEARAKGCKLVELLTHHTRVDAQRFYERLGFARSHVGMTLRF